MAYMPPTNPTLPGRHRRRASTICGDVPRQVRPHGPAKHPSRLLESLDLRQTPTQQQHCVAATPTLNVAHLQAPTSYNSMLQSVRQYDLGEWSVDPSILWDLQGNKTILLSTQEQAKLGVAQLFSLAMIFDGPVTRAAAVKTFRHNTVAVMRTFPGSGNLAYLNEFSHDFEASIQTEIDASLQAQCGFAPFAIKRAQQATHVFYPLAHGSLADVLRGNAFADLSAPERMDFMATVFAGVGENLHNLQQAGLSHQDIKPGNVLVDLGFVPRAQLADYGFARPNGPYDENAGSLLFKSPDAWIGERYDVNKDDAWAFARMCLFVANAPWVETPLAMSLVLRANQEEENERRAKVWLRTYGQVWQHRMFVADATQYTAAARKRRARIGNDGNAQQLDRELAVLKGHPLQKRLLRLLDPSATERADATQTWRAHQAAIAAAPHRTDATMTTQASQETLAFALRRHPGDHGALWAVYEQQRAVPIVDAIAAWTLKDQLNIDNKHAPA